MAQAGGAIVSMECDLKGASKRVLCSHLNPIHLDKTQSSLNELKGQFPSTSFNANSLACEVMQEPLAVSAISAASFV